MGRKLVRTTNKSLPEAFLEGAVWKASVTPSMIKWAGTFPKIFKIPASSIVPVLEVVCRHYYEDDTITLDEKHPAVLQVCTQLILLLILTIPIDAATPHRPIQRSSWISGNIGSSCVSVVLP